MKKCLQLLVVVGLVALCTASLSVELSDVELDAFLEEAAEIERTPEVCDFIASGDVCLGGGDKVIAPDAALPGLVGHWSFDDIKGIDSSGDKRHVVSGPPAAGPGMGGFGTSAAFSGKNHVKIANVDGLRQDEFSLSFWMYLLQDSSGHWRPVVHRGSDDVSRGPAIYLDPLFPQLAFYLSTTDKAHDHWGEYVKSTAQIPLRRWTHVAAVRENNYISLYVNGILEAKNATATPKEVTGPLYVGGVPWSQQPGANMYLDELQYFNRALTEAEIQAQASTALGGVEPDFVRLGCAKCTLREAADACKAVSGYHLCYDMDLYSGAYQVSRIMGWDKNNAHIWSGEEAQEWFGEHKEGSLHRMNAGGLGICCRDQ